MGTTYRHNSVSIILKNVIIISFLALFTSHKSSAFADWYSSTIYPLFVSSIGRFFGIFQFSVSEIGLYIFVILLFLSLIRMLISSIYKMYAQKKNPAWLGYGSSLLLLCGCLFTIYTFFCGINYGHTSFAEKYHLESGQYTQAELTSLCNELTDQLNTLSNSLGRDSDGLADMGKDLQDRARAAMFSLGATYPELSGYYPQPKGLLFPAFLSVQNLSGIYSPFTIEANYNSAMVSYNLPFTICHELSHLRGFMQEE